MWKKIMATAAVATAVIFAVAFMGCQQEEEGPPLPSLATMTMDLSTFGESANAALKLGKADGVGPKSNFNNAAFRVGWLNLSIAGALAGPVFVLGLALTDSPSWDNGVWTWDVSGKQGGHEHQALLKAWFDGNLKEGVWLNLEMQVTCTGCKVPTEDFLWYTGRFHTVEQKGHWQFFNPEIAQEDRTFVRIDYEVTDNTHKSLTFTNLRTDGHENAGDIIEYIVDADLAHVSVHDAGDGIDYVVEWSLSTGSGVVEVPDYNEGEPACWDSSQQNIECP
jgi:hypothetical protein